MQPRHFWSPRYRKLEHHTMTSWHTLELATILRQLETDIAQGLTEGEAIQRLARSRRAEKMADLRPGSLGMGSSLTKRQR